MPESTTIRRVVCHLDEIKDPGSKGLSIACSGRFLDVFVVREGMQVFGYVNSCPHTGSPLDWMPDQFLSLDKRYIQCATHAARFRLQDGVCISGPCAGERLAAVPAVVEAGKVVLMLPAITDS
ncbi:MAG: Rieske 2Fe-2S domain-containing protein [Gammaproteobacteria bacterium]